MMTIYLFSFPTLLLTHLQWSHYHFSTQSDHFLPIPIPIPIPIPYSYYEGT